MSAKRGRIARMAAIAALGLALSACGGGAGNSLGTAAASESPAPQAPPAQGSAPAPGSADTAGAAPTQGAAPAQGSSPAQGSPPAQDPAPSQSTPATGGNAPATSSDTVTINWTPPTENTDGTTLANLAGYRIHYGTASKRYTQAITVSNPGLARYVISSLPPGTYYFSVTAYNSAGTESPLSSEVSAKVD